MAQVTLRDLASNEDIVVPPEGFIFGRVGGDADIQLEDNSISRRQARVSLKGGMWLLETLAVPQGARAPRPVQLQEGATFTVGQSEFEVVQVEAEEEAEADPAARTFTPQKGKPGPAPAAAPARKAPAPPNAKTTPSPAQKRPPPPQAGAAPASDEAPAKGIGAMFVGVPKGIAYYLVNVPKMLVNPFGTVRKTIEELPAEPMGRTELIGYALPALLATGLLGSIASGIATLIAGGGFQLMLFIPIVPAISAVIGAVVTGFIFHPVLTWVIKFLKGESDARSRSNYFLQSMTLSILLAVPSALGSILTALPVPFIGLIGLVLGVLATLVSLYVTVQWFTFFNVVKWFKTVLMVLGALLVLSAVWGLVQGVIASVKSLGSGGSTSTAVAAPEGESELGDVPPSDPEEQAVWAKKKQAEAQAKVAEMTRKAQAGIDDAKGKTDDAVKAAKDDPPEPKPEPKAADPKPEPKAADPKPEPRPEPVAVKDTPPPVKDEPTPAPSQGYANFAKRRDAIEKLFENDPTVLQRSGDLQKLYGEYIEEAYDLDKKWGKETAKKPERAKLNARLRDAELFGKTGKTIDTLAGKLNIH